MVKDLKIFAADRTALIFAILFPFFLLFLFNFVMGDIGGSDSRLVINLATREPAGTGQLFNYWQRWKRTDVSSLKPGEPDIVWLKDYDKAKQDVGIKSWTVSSDSG